MGVVAWRRAARGAAGRAAGARRQPRPRAGQGRPAALAPGQRPLRQGGLQADDAGHARGDPADATPAQAGPLRRRRIRSRGDGMTGRSPS